MVRKLTALLLCAVLAFGGAGFYGCSSKQLQDLLNQIEDGLNEQAAVALAVSVSDIDCVYDGKKHEPNVSLTVAGGGASEKDLSSVAYALEYYEGGRKLDGAPVDAGEYTVTATVTGNGYTGSGQASVKIAKRAVAAAFGNLQAEYNGSAHAPSVAFKYADTGATVEEQLKYSIKYFDGFDGNGEERGSAPVGTGYYTAEIELNERNYICTQNSARANMAVSKGAASIVFNQQKSFEYNGAKRDIGFSIKGADNNVIAKIGYTLEYLKGGESLGAEAPKDVGGYSLKVILTDANYTGSGSFDFSITPKEVTVDVENCAAAYAEGYNYEIEYNLSEKVDVTVTYDGKTEKPSAPGLYEIKVTVSDSNYSGVGTAVLRLLPTEGSVALFVSNPEYNGKAHEAEAYGLDPELDEFGITYNGKTSAPVDAGTYTVVLTYTLAGTDITGTIEKEMIIRQKEINVAPVQANGSSITYSFGDNMVLTFSGLPDGVTPEITYDGVAEKPKNAGAYAVKITITDPNYKGDYQGTLTISPKELDLTPSNSLNKENIFTYGADIALTFNALEPETIKNLNIEYYEGGDKLGGAPENAGEYTVRISTTDPNYTGSYEGKVTINRKSYVLQPQKDYFYNTDGSAVRIVISDMPAEVRSLVAIVFLDAADNAMSAPSDVGTYKVRISLDAQNFTGVTYTGEIKINKAVVDLQLASETLIYNGAVQTLGFANLPQGAPQVDVTANAYDAGSPSELDYTKLQYPGMYAVSAVCETANIRYETKNAVVSIMFDNPWEAFSYGKNFFENVAKNYRAEYAAVSTNDKAGSPQSTKTVRERNTAENKFTYYSYCYGDTILGADPRFGIFMSKALDGDAISCLWYAKSNIGVNGAIDMNKGESRPYNDLTAFKAKYGTNPALLSVYEVTSSTITNLTAVPLTVIKNNGAFNGYSVKFNFNKDSEPVSGYQKQVKEYSGYSYKSFASLTITYTFDKYGRIIKAGDLTDQYSITVIIITANVTLTSEENFYYYS